MSIVIVHLSIEANDHAAGIFVSLVGGHAPAVETIDLPADDDSLAWRVRADRRVRRRRDSSRIGLGIGSVLATPRQRR
jgi:hypothetical protein